MKAISHLHTQDSKVLKDKKHHTKSDRAKANNKAVKDCRSRQEKRAKERVARTKILKNTIPALKENIRARVEMTENLLNLFQECHPNQDKLSQYLAEFEKIKCRAGKQCFESRGSY